MTLKQPIYTSNMMPLSFTCLVNSTYCCNSQPAESVYLHTNTNKQTVIVSKSIWQDFLSCNTREFFQWQSDSVVLWGNYNFNLLFICVLICLLLSWFTWLCIFKEFQPYCLSMILMICVFECQPADILTDCVYKGYIRPFTVYYF